MKQSCICKHFTQICFFHVAAQVQNSSVQVNDPSTGNYERGLNCHVPGTCDLEAYIERAARSAGLISGFSFFGCSGSSSLYQKLVPLSCLPSIQLGSATSSFEGGRLPNLRTSAPREGSRAGAEMWCGAARALEDPPAACPPLTAPFVGRLKDTRSANGSNTAFSRTNMDGSKRRGGSSMERDAVST